MASIQGLLSSFNAEPQAFSLPAIKPDAQSGAFREPAIAQSGGGSVSLSQSAVLQQYSRELRNERSVSVDLITREGDRVTIQLSNVFQEGLKTLNGAATVRGGERSASLAFSSFERSVSLSDQLYFSVEGDLNPEEQAAIEALLFDIDDLLEDFFAGDVNQALSEALAIEIDGGQIAALSLDANQSILSKEIQTYQTVQQFNSGTAKGFTSGDAGFDLISIEQLLAVLEAKTRELLDKFQKDSGVSVDGRLSDSAQLLLSPFLKQGQGNSD